MNLEVTTLKTFMAAYLSQHLTWDPKWDSGAPQKDRHQNWPWLGQQRVQKQMLTCIYDFTTSKNTYFSCAETELLNVSQFAFLLQSEIFSQSDNAKVKYFQQTGTCTTTPLIRVILNSGHAISRILLLALGPPWSFQKTDANKVNDHP